MPVFLADELITRLDALTTLRNKLVKERHVLTSLEIISLEKDFSSIAGWFLFYEIPVKFSQKAQTYKITDPNIKSKLVDENASRWFQELVSLFELTERSELQERRMVQLRSFLSETETPIEEENGKLSMKLNRLPFKSGRIGQ
jgi:hypothetical protein